MNESFEQSEMVNSVRYELAIVAEEARLGAKKILSRQGKRLEVNIPAGVVTGSTVKLADALQLTDGRPGDILIQIKVKDEEMPARVIEVDDGNFELRFSTCRTIAPLPACKWVMRHPPSTAADVTAMTALPVMPRRRPSSINESNCFSANTERIPEQGLL